MCNHMMGRPVVPQVARSPPTCAICRRATTPCTPPGLCCGSFATPPGRAEGVYLQQAPKFMRQLWGWAKVGSHWSSIWVVVLGRPALVWHSTASLLSPWMPPPIASAMPPPWRDAGSFERAVPASCSVGQKKHWQPRKVQTSMWSGFWSIFLRLLLFKVTELDLVDPKDTWWCCVSNQPGPTKNLCRVFVYSSPL